MRVLLLNISDIHVKLYYRPENEGRVLRKFIEDVDKQVKEFTYDDVFVLISGDLVFAASDDSYEQFDEVIVKELMRVLKIDRKHFIIAPGNHDVMQDAIKKVKRSFMHIFNGNYDEEGFNDLIREETGNAVFGKFEAFHRYMRDKMGNEDYSLLANMCEINETWSVHVLNSAILSCGGYNNNSDKEHLGVDTRSLEEFIQKDNRRMKKILLMHHPEYYCMDWVREELRKLYGSEYALILSGHTHDKYCYRDAEEGYIRCEAPQLFTDKKDHTLGYNFIELVGDKVMKITYRQWSWKGNEFKPGSDFVKSEDGVIIFENEDTINLQENINARNIRPQAIDLGLKSGTKWASFNVGATKPEEYGEHFAWGETEKKKDGYYDWNTYIHCDGSEETCHDLGSDISGTQYDVAHVRYGSNWQMPTQEQFEELLASCNLEWTTLNGIRGYKFKSKYNGNSIFLPAAGDRKKDEFCDVGSHGAYWYSSRVSSKLYQAFELYFSSGNADTYSYNRNFGMSIRAVFM